MSKTERYTVFVSTTAVEILPASEGTFSLEAAFRHAKFLAGWEVRQRVRGNRFGPIFAQCPVSRVDLPGDVYREAPRPHEVVRA